MSVDDPPFQPTLFRPTPQHSIAAVEMQASPELSGSRSFEHEHSQGSLSPSPPAEKQDGGGDELQEIFQKQVSVMVTPNDTVGGAESPMKRAASLSATPNDVQRASSLSGSYDGVARALSLSQYDHPPVSRSPLNSLFHASSAEPPSANDGHQSPQPPQEPDGHGEALAGFRPPSPANVVHVLERFSLDNPPEDTPESDLLAIAALKSKLKDQGDDLVKFGLPCGVKPIAGQDFDVEIPIVPQLLSFFKLYNEPPSKHGRKHSRSNSMANSGHSAINAAAMAAAVASAAASVSPSAEGSPIVSRRGSISGSAINGSPNGLSMNALAAANMAANANTISASSSSGLGVSSPSTMGLSSPLTQQRSLDVPRANSLQYSTTNGNSPSGFTTGANTPRRGSFSASVAPSNAVSAFELTLPDNRQLLRDLLREYADIYWENSRAFAAFYKKRTEDMNNAQKADIVYHHLKGRESQQAALEKPVKKLMEANKKQLLAYFEDQLGVRSLQIARLAPRLINAGSACVQGIQMMQAAKEDYLEAVNAAVGRLRQQFLDVRQLVDARLAEHVLAQYTNIPSYDELNTRILQVVFEPDLHQAIAAYHQAYRQAASTLPGRILLSSLLRNRIESRTHLDDITFNDLIIAVEESTSHLRKSIHAFMLVHPDLTTEILHGPLPSKLAVTEVTPEHAASSEKLGAIYKKALLGFLRASRIYPKLLTPATFKLVKKLRLVDMNTFRLLSENRYQEALWRLHDCGLEGQADMLESWMHKAVFNDNHVVDCKNLGGGFTTTKLMTMQADDSEIPGLTSHSGIVSGVYKPKPKVSIFKLQSLADGLVSNHKKEVAAYRIDKLLQLYHVPMTKSMLWEEREGSLQIFVQNAVSARAVQEFNMHKPSAPGKFSAPKGRSVLPRRIRLFDFLIDNRDRNLDNYLISSIDQRIVLIDHGWTFTTPNSVNEITNYHNSGFLRSIIPNRRLFERCRFLSQHTELIDKELMHLLSKENLNSFKHRLHLFVKFVEEEVRHHGVDTTFRLADEEDRRSLCDCDGNVTCVPSPKEPSPSSELSTSGRSHHSHSGNHSLSH